MILSKNRGRNRGSLNRIILEIGKGQKKENWLFVKRFKGGVLISIDLDLVPVN